MTADLLAAVAAAIVSTEADRITLAVQPPITRWSERVLIYGTLAERGAGQKVANHPQFGLPLVSSGTDDFRLRVPRGTTLLRT